MISRLGRALALLALLASFACGGDDGGGDTVAVSDYAGTVCTELGSWFETIQAETEAFQQEAGTLGDDLEAAKEAAASFLDDVIRATDRALDRMADAGQPDVDEGPELAAELQSGFQRVQEEFQRARDEVEAVDTDDREAFAETFEGLRTRLQSGSVQSEAFGGLERFDDNQELTRAFEEQPACQEIG